MLVWAYLEWWYGSGWRDNGAAIWRRNDRIYLSFSIPILLSTLFAPWRRIVSGSDGTLPQQLRAGVDNLLSRIIGFIVRMLALLAAGIMMLANVILGLLVFVAWPLVPILGIALICWGVVG